jgi:hypothetical protein
MFLCFRISLLFAWIVASRSLQFRNENCACFPRKPTSLPSLPFCLCLLPQEVAQCDSPASCSTTSHLAIHTVASLLGVVYGRVQVMRPAVTATGRPAGVQRRPCHENARCLPPLCVSV